VIGFPFGIAAILLAVMNFTIRGLPDRFEQKLNRHGLFCLFAFPNLLYITGLPTSMFSKYDTPFSIEITVIRLLVVIFYIGSYNYFCYSTVLLRKEGDRPSYKEYQGFIPSERLTTYKIIGWILSALIQFTAWAAGVEFLSHVFNPEGHYSAHIRSIPEIFAQNGFLGELIGVISWTILLILLELPGCFSLLLIIITTARGVEEWIEIVKGKIELEKKIPHSSLILLKPCLKNLKRVFFRFSNMSKTKTWPLLVPVYAISIKKRFFRTEQFWQSDILHELGHVDFYKKMPLLSKVIFSLPPFGEVLFSLTHDSYEEEKYADDYAIANGVPPDLLVAQIEMEKTSNINIRLRKPGVLNWFVKLVTESDISYWHPHSDERIRRIKEKYSTGCQQ
jgi:hypothetical protein